jgi:hypothetical protein
MQDRIGSEQEQAQEQEEMTPVNHRTNLGPDLRGN